MHTGALKGHVWLLNFRTKNQYFTSGGPARPPPQGKQVLRHSKDGGTGMVWCRANADVGHAGRLLHTANSDLMHNSHKLQLAGCCAVVAQRSAYL
eukprot:1153412-Pelagomonas_calceolata.AAC.2